MQIVKPLLLVLLGYSLLSCETTKPATTIIGAEKTSKCGELPAGVTIDKREFRLAGAKLGEFSLGEAAINSTPEFTQILSEASKNKVIQSVLTCNAIELAGVAHDAEMVAYFIQMQDFLSTNPSLDDRIKWAQAFPIPTTRKPKETSQNKAAIRQLVGEGYTLKASIDGDYRSHRKQNSFAANQDKLLKTWRAQISAWEDSVAATLQQIDPIVRAQFQNYTGGSGPRPGENMAWADLSGALNGKLNFLIQVMSRL